uniref:Uncoordinated protein 79 n=1 Tax=Romanomermis culicivorax TaxID=13658 RepID=A0A915IDA1_ROMCU
MLSVHPFDRHSPSATMLSPDQQQHVGVDTRIMEEIEEFDRSFRDRVAVAQEATTEQMQPLFQTAAVLESAIAEGPFLQEASHKAQVVECTPVVHGKTSPCDKLSEHSLRLTQSDGQKKMSEAPVEAVVRILPPNGKLESSSKSYSVDDSSLRRKPKLEKGTRFEDDGHSQQAVKATVSAQKKLEELVNFPKISYLDPIGEETRPTSLPGSESKLHKNVKISDKVQQQQVSADKSKEYKEKEKFQTPPICIGSLRYAETTVSLRCTQCNVPYEMYDEDTLALAVVCLSTAVHRDPAMCAPHLLRILISVSRIANYVYHPWQVERYKPCFFKTVCSSLLDFVELNPVTVVQILLKLEDLIVNWPTMVHHVVANLADYVVNIPVDSYLNSWGSVIPLLDSFLRRYLVEVNEVAADIQNFFSILNHVLRVQSFHTFKTGLLLLDSMCKLLSKIIQTQAVKIVDLLTICSSCNRAFLKERDKEGLARCCVNELVLGIKFKTSLPEDNYMTIVKLILEDIGEIVDDSLDKAMYNTAVADVAKIYMQDFIDFIADLHVLHRMKTAVRGSGLKEDTLGGDVKAGLARYVSYEISRANCRDPRTIIRYVPWLLNPPTVTLQGPTEFIDCVGHVRQLSWILLGALYCNGSISCMPIPIETSHHISDHIQFVLAGFAEQSKESVLHMSALFHAFHLCQLWTVYCEEICSRNPETDLAKNAGVVVAEFWARITPAILQLLSHSKVLADMVNLHFLNTVEALTECDSDIISKLFPMWHPILSAYHQSVPGHLVVRLDACENTLPKSEKRRLEPWLKRVCFKISQVELQSSAATQFYTSETCCDLTSVFI